MAFTCDCVVFVVGCVMLCFSCVCVWLGMCVCCCCLCLVCDPLCDVVWRVVVCALFSVRVCNSFKVFACVVCVLWCDGVWHAYFVFVVVCACVFFCC